jgi:hypothetical protein
MTDHITLRRAAYEALEALHGDNHREAFKILYSELAKPGQEPLLERFAALVGERDALRADAERYRWLRTTRDGGFWCCHEKDGEGGQILKYEADLDAAIDAAREKK